MPQLEHPYHKLSGGHWLRGNLHTHTTQSDGERPMQAVVDDYAQRGYGFLMFSDHDIHSGPVQYEKLKDRGLLLIPGSEITANGPHMLHVNAGRRVEPHADRQQVIDEIRAGPGFAIVNHPNWEQHFDHCPFENLVRWQGYCGMEIYNGVIERLDGTPYAADKWDMLLAQGRRVWGFANDDSHAAQNDVALGWNVVYAAERTVPAVLEALRTGRFYASTGVVIKQITVRGHKIRIETENADRIVAYRNTGCRFAVVDDTALEITVPENATYVRFECLGPRGARAWTQPFFIN